MQWGDNLMAADPILNDSGGNKDTSLLNPKLAALKMGQSLMDPDNPTVHVVSPEFKLSESLLQGTAGFFLVYSEDDIEQEHPLNDGLQSVLEVFDHFERGSPSIDGIGRQQIVECVVNSSRSIYQGIPSLQDDNKPGVVSRLLSFATGRGGGAQK